MEDGGWRMATRGRTAIRSEIVPTDGVAIPRMTDDRRPIVPPIIRVRPRTTVPEGVRWGRGLPIWDGLTLSGSPSESRP